MAGVRVSVEVGIRVVVAVDDGVREAVCVIVAIAVAVAVGVLVALGIRVWVAVGNSGVFVDKEADRAWPRQAARISVSRRHTGIKFRKEINRRTDMETSLNAGEK